MTFCVLDSSSALAWVLPAEAEGAPTWLTEINTQGAVVPSLWRLEVAHVLLTAERRRRITLADRHQALDALDNLPISIDPLTDRRAWGDTVTLAAAYGLTVYDASYLELAIRRGLPLATLDAALRRAAATCGVSAPPAHP